MVDYMMNKNKAIVIIPAYNEENTLKKVVADVRSVGFHQIVVIDDGSNDKTAAIAKKLNVMCLNLLINRGMGAATQTGIFWGIDNGFEYFLTIDADSQQSAKDLEQIFFHLETHHCVIGSRFLQANKIPFLRRIANKCANFFTGLFFSVWITDSQSGLRGFTRKVAQELNLYANGFEYCSEFIREVNAVGFKIHEIPISVKYSKESMQKGQSFSEGIKTLGKLFLKAISR